MFLIMTKQKVKELRQNIKREVFEDIYEDLLDTTYDEDYDTANPIDLLGQLARRLDKRLVP